MTGGPSAADGRPDTRDDRARRLARFRGDIDEQDQRQYDYWRDASDAEHGRVLAELMDLTAALPRQGPREMFCGFRAFLDRCDPGRKPAVPDQPDQPGRG